MGQFLDGLRREWPSILVGGLLYGSAGLAGIHGVTVAYVLAVVLAAAGLAYGLAVAVTVHRDTRTDRDTHAYLDRTGLGLHQRTALHRPARPRHHARSRRRSARPRPAGSDPRRALTSTVTR